MGRRIRQRAAAFLLLMAIPARAEYVNSDNGVRIRETPSTDSKILGVLSFGTPVDGEIDLGWMRLADGGYICADYVQGNDPLEDLEYLGEWRVTAYAYTGSPCANGSYPTEGYTIACNSLPLGARVYIKGVGFRTVEDRGPTYLGDAWCDLYLGDVGRCIQWGDQYRAVYVAD